LGLGELGAFALEGGGGLTTEITESTEEEEELRLGDLGLGFEILETGVPGEGVIWSFRVSCAEMAHKRAADSWWWLTVRGGAVGKGRWQPKTHDRKGQ
jgi:hypothetical protein